MPSNKPMKFDPSAKPLFPFESTFGFPLFNRLSHEFDTLVNRFAMDRPLLETPSATWMPQIEMFSKENEFHVKVDVPGMKKDDVTLEVAEDHLILRGERKTEKEEKKEGFFRTERTYGSFYRTVPLPDGVNPELAKATMHDGVLEISMPMVKVEEKSRKLEITEPAPVKTTKAA